MIDQARRLNPIFPPGVMLHAREAARLEKSPDSVREAMIALRALTLAAGRTAEARQTLLLFAEKMDHEMAVLRAVDSNGKSGTEAGSADGPLWFLYGVQQFVRYTGDYSFTRQHLYPVMENIISWYVRGTPTGIKVDGCGLVNLGKLGLPLTWMDATVDGQAITPRHGKPVEVQALWYNALCFMEELARHAGNNGAANRFAGRAALAHWSFNRLFWNSDKGCLYDVVRAGVSDAAIRPNQIFAVSLPHSMLPEDRARSVVDVVQRELLTPIGVRTLAPGEARYRGQCRGDGLGSLEAYHQGCAWLWLVSPFSEAYMKVHRLDQGARDRLRAALVFTADLFSQNSASPAAEIFDGDWPHAPRGNPSRLWSLAELWRVLAEVGFASKSKNLTQASTLAAVAG